MPGIGEGDGRFQQRFTCANAGHEAVEVVVQQSELGFIANRRKTDLAQNLRSQSSASACDYADPIESLGGCFLVRNAAELLSLAGHTLLRLCRQVQLMQMSM